MSRPNILYILSDQHAQGVSGCYGDPVVRTPNIDRLAAGGVRFENAYTPSPLCLPARMSLLTGRYPYRNRCWTNTDSLASDIPTFAHAQGAVGYAPILIGRMHALGSDQLHGYVRREIGDHMTDWYGGSEYSMGILNGAQRPNREALQLSGAGQSSYEVLDREVTGAAIEEIRLIAENRRNGDDTPFSLSVGYILPHQPYAGDPELVDYYLERISPPRLSRQEDGEPEFLSWWRDAIGMNAMTVTEEMRAKAAYYALVETMDREIGKIVDELVAQQLSENTLIIYTSDHGDQLGERDLWFKQTFYDHSAKVPLILNWPKELPKGIICGRVVNLTDLSATMVDAAGHDPLPQSDGQSLLDLAKAPETPWDDTTFSEYCSDGMQAWAPGRMILSRMIRKGKWKLNYYYQDRHQLFDLHNDPDEITNIYGHPKHAQIQSELLVELLSNWSPEDIQKQLESSKATKKILRNWAASTGPVDRYRWMTEVDQNWLRLGS